MMKHNVRNTMTTDMILTPEENTGSKNSLLFPVITKPSPNCLTQDRRWLQAGIKIFSKVFALSQYHAIIIADSELFTQITNN